MGIKISGIKETVLYLREETNKITVEEVAEGLVGIGERVVQGIIDGELSNWNDQTRNLRSSIGYIVTVDGQVRNEGGFQQHAGTGEGASEGEAYARSLVPLYPKGVALIIVAGMEYASYVEAMENKTVLAEGSLEAERLIAELTRKLNQRYSK